MTSNPENSIVGRWHIRAETEDGKRVDIGEFSWWDGGREAKPCWDGIADDYEDADPDAIYIAERFVAVEQPRNPLFRLERVERRYKKCEHCVNGERQGVSIDPIDGDHVEEWYTCVECHGDYQSWEDKTKSTT